jgi:rhodanese-related sulfurtransferase
MALSLAVAGVLAVVAFGISLVVRLKRRRDQRVMEQHSITADELYALLASDPEVLLFDVRQPLDLLAYPEVIPEAQRVAPSEVLANPTLIPNDKESVVYCTCPSDKTSRMVLRRALALGISRIKFLQGGLAAWKAKGYPVVPYKGVFQLSPSLVPRSQ